MIPLEKMALYLERLNLLKKELEVYGNPHMFLSYNIAEEQCSDMIHQEQNPRETFDTLLRVCDILAGIVRLLNQNMNNESYDTNPDFITPSYNYKLYNDVAKRISNLIDEIKKEAMLV